MAEGGNRRREDPHVRRAQILAAAKRSFSAKGLQGTTVDRIALEAGVSVGLLYRFFRSKAAIVEAIIMEQVEVQLAEMEMAIEQTKGRLDRLPKLITRQVTESSIDNGRLALMLELMAEVCRNSDLRAFVREKRGELQEALAAKLQANGLNLRQARRFIERLDWAGAIASGLVVQEIIYSRADQRFPTRMRKLIEAIVSGN